MFPKQKQRETEMREKTEYHIIFVLYGTKLLNFDRKGPRVKVAEFLLTCLVDYQNLFPHLTSFRLSLAYIQ